MQSIFHTCPKTKELLHKRSDGLLKGDGTLYPFIQQENNFYIPNFLAEEDHNEAVKKSLDIYDHDTSIEIYENFLDWLFQTFNQDEMSFRKSLIEKLKLPEGGKVLITGCGLGDDVSVALDFVGPDGQVHANDLAVQMVVSASNHIKSKKLDSKNIFLSVCDAQELPFPDDFFDGTFHFGGINLFDNIALAISEMDRVTKPGCRVVFGDESIAPWLKDTEYGHAAVNNNALWKVPTPINLLPSNAVDVNLSWVLGNCFYVIDFEVSNIGPFMDLDVPHKGPRGGTIKTRYYGQLEGVTKETKEYVIKDAKSKGISIHNWLEEVIQKQKKS
jgi:ubiquinone/menaquinone biosynthesis C-methylase UbiE